MSRLIMTIPKNGLVKVADTQGGATGSRRYFHFEGDAHRLIISGWFEAETEFTGIRQVWEADIAAWRRKNLPEPQNVSFVDIGKWKAVIYDLNIPSVTNSHIRAHWLQAGTWIDIHLSMTEERQSAEVRSSLRDALETIRVVEKKS